VRYYTRRGDQNCKSMAASGAFRYSFPDAVLTGASRALVVKYPKVTRFCSTAHSGDWRMLLGPLCFEIHNQCGLRRQRGEWKCGIYSVSSRPPTCLLEGLTVKAGCVFNDGVSAPHRFHFISSESPELLDMFL
jgi:hypothetical protein